MKKNFNNLINYIKNNKIYIIIMLLCFSFLLIQMKQVVLYADDFVLKTVSIKGIKNIISNQINHYLTWGGGFTPILVTTFLLFKSMTWKFFISLLILLIFSLTIKLLGIKDQFEKCLIAIMMWSGLFFVNISILNQTLYWLDGSFAYTFTIFQVFIYIYFIITRIFRKISHKYDIILFPIISFFAGWSSAQTGAIVLILPILVIIYHKVRKINISKLNYISMFLGIIGFAIFYFAPGNSARMSSMGIFSELNFFEKIMYKSSGVYSHLINFKNMLFTSTPFYLIIASALLIILGYHYIKKDNKKNIIIKSCLIYMFVMLIMYLGINFDVFGNDVVLKYFISFPNLYELKDSLSLTVFIPYIITSVFIICSIVVSHYIYSKTNDPVSLVFIVSGYISQFVMVMSPAIEYRTTFIIILFLIVSIADLIHLCYKERISNYYLLLLPILMFEFKYGLVSLLVLSFINTIKNVKKIYIINFAIIILILAYPAFINYSVTYNKYKENKYIYYENIEALSSYKSGDEIYIKEYPHPEYAFTNIAGTGWVEDAIREMYGIDKSVNFVLIK